MLARLLRLTRPSRMLVGICCVLATAPAWIVRYPPLQDLPLHVSALRVISDFADPRFAFGDHFELALGKTAYVLFYLLGTLLAPVFGVHGATVVLMSVYLGGTPLALSALCRSLGRDERLGLIAVPLVVNAMFMLGLLPFVLALPLMLMAMALTVSYVETPTLGRGVLLGALGVALFFCHVFPFALFGVVYALVFPWLSPRRWLHIGAPALPGLGCVLWWSLATTAGSGAAEHLDLWRPRPLAQSFALFPRVTTDVFRDHTDEWCGGILLALVVAAWFVAWRDEEPRRKLLLRYAAIVPVCLAGYLFLGNQLGDVYLLADRFAVPLLFCLVPLLRLPRGARGWGASAAIAAVGIASIVNVCAHFRRFERKELGHFDRALAVMEPGQRVVGLMFDRSSRITRTSPFLHFVSYYQAQKGGLVMFSYAGFPHWPFHFRAGHFPPPGRAPRLGWEWGPKHVGMKEIYPYYDYVLRRGDAKKLPRRTHRLIYEDRRWQVWQKKELRSAARLTQP